MRIARESTLSAHTSLRFVLSAICVTTILKSSRGKIFVLKIFVLNSAYVCGSLLCVKGNPRVVDLILMKMNTILTFLCSHSNRVCAQRPCWKTKTIEDVCMKIEYISQRKIIVLFWSSNMAVVHTLLIRPSSRS